MPLDPSLYVDSDSSGPGLANKSQTDGTWYTKQKQIMTATYSIYTASEMRTIPMPHLCATAILPPHQGIRPSTRYR